MWLGQIIILINIVENHGTFPKEWRDGDDVLGGCKESFVCVCVCARACSPTLGKVKKAEETVHCREDRWPL